MSQASALKSLQLTALDTIPPNGYTTGEGAPGMVRRVDGFVTAVSADTTSSVYKMVRLPSNAKVKKVTINSSIASAGSGDINVAYSDSTMDGTQPALQGTIPQISSANNQLFGAAASLVLAGVTTDFTFKNLTNYPQSAANLPLWLAVGLASDPGGFFDIQINITTAVTTGGLVLMSVDYVE